MIKTIPFFGVAIVLLFARAMAGSLQAQGDESTRVLMLINQARVNAGLVQYAISPQLSAAAQAHADDMARSGVSIGHNGSDGSTPTKRIIGAGYHPYSWGPIVGENWAAFRTVDESMNAWMSDQPHRANILSPVYREIGVGVATSGNGVPILVTDFGAQPNVLPVFVNRAGPPVVLALANENAAPEGDGTGVIGRAVSVDISTDSAFAHSLNEPYGSTIAYTPSEGVSASTIFVRFHDALGRTTLSSASTSAIVVAPAAAPATTATVPPTRRVVSTPQVLPTRAKPSPSPSATVSPTSTVDDYTSTPFDVQAVIAASPSSTPAASQAAILRRPLAAPAVTSAASSPNPWQPLVDQFALGLVGASIVLALVAGTTARRARRR